MVSVCKAVEPETLFEIVPATLWLAKAVSKATDPPVLTVPLVIRAPCHYGW